MPNIPRDSVSVVEAADMLGTSVWTVARRIRAGELPAVRANGAARAPYLIARADVLKLIAAAERTAA
jgi:excisionase family DNA binding protein